MFGRNGTTTGQAAKPGETGNTAATRATGARKGQAVKAKPPTGKGKSAN